MDKCRRCPKNFTPTSWTRDNYWRSVCPSCIIKLLDERVGREGKEVPPPVSHEGRRGSR